MSSQTAGDPNTSPTVPSKIDPGIQVKRDSSTETSKTSPSVNVLDRARKYTEPVGEIEDSQAKPISAGAGQPETPTALASPQSRTDTGHSMSRNHGDTSPGLANPVPEGDGYATTNQETPEDVGNHDQATVQGRRGDTFYDQYAESGSLEDIASAIECYGQAALLTPDGRADKPKWVGNLGASYQSRFQALGKLADLDMAIDCNSRALLLTLEGSLGKSTRLNNLGASYLSRYESLNQLSDLNEAIDYQSKAVLLAPEAHPDRPAWLSNLGISHLTRFEHMEEIADLNKAIEYTSRAASSTGGE
ncbi:hypothetical protein FRC08_007119, partial [Ceratobasidium sp. 394]